ncbi:MAG: ABC transporter ATP-binding protein [Pseudomonadota bacterium]|nr:ABC transporter ATP-binding protein [Pseudomonadota bacterium]
MHIIVKNIFHDFKTETGVVPVLKDLSFSVKKGAFIALVGPSGCGKSTVTRLLSGLLEPDKGEIILSDEKVTSPRATVGMAFQNPVLLEWRNILQNTSLPLEIVSKQLSNSERTIRAQELLELVGLAEFETNRPSELSGGMKQRVSLCRALVHKPELLILDEPFGALDAFTKEDLWGTMRMLKKEENFTCILITHDLREAMFLADEVLVLSGRPATLQYKLKVQLGKNRKISDLYSREATRSLAILREQIEIAQKNK